MTIETKHTPGPWRVHSERTAPYYVKDAEVYAGDVMICGHILARAESDGDGLKVVAGERAANARLIAAAPDMYDAIVATIKRSGGNLHDTDQETGETFHELLHAAIAKATGEAK